MIHNVEITTAQFNVLVDAAQLNPALSGLLSSLREQIMSKDYFFPSDDDERDDDEHDQFRSDAEADGDALASAGFGTDEDYGCFGGGED